MTDHEKINRAAWNEFAEDYQAENAAQIMAQAFTGKLCWGTWHIPEARLQVLGDVDGKDVLELGSGAAQMSMALSHHGARAIGLDLSENQLAIARRLMRETGVTIPIVQGSGERTPFRNETFDVVFSDYGALFWADPYLTVPEAARLLRPGGLLAFTHYSPISTIATPYEAEHAQERFVNDYFGIHIVPLSDGTISFQLPYGEWTQLFWRCGLVVEELIEPRPDKNTSRHLCRRGGSAMVAPLAVGVHLACPKAGRTLEVVGHSLRWSGDLNRMATHGQGGNCGT